MKDQAKFTCQTPTPGKKGTNIPRWKYELLRQKILTLLEEVGDTGMGLQDLTKAVAAQLPPDEAQQIGSITWHLMSVKLHMEAMGELNRITVKGRQKLRLAQL